MLVEIPCVIFILKPDAEYITVYKAVPPAVKVVEERQPKVLLAPTYRLVNKPKFVWSPSKIREYVSRFSIHFSHLSLNSVASSSSLKQNITVPNSIVIVRDHL